MVAMIYKIESEIWGVLPPPNKMVAQKHQRQRVDSFGQLCNLIANISSLEQDIADRNVITPLHVCQMW